jgi:glycosyltransferase involved in cell wall biosynthesis
MRILAPIRYPWTFNGPRQSRHVIERRAFLPLNKISARIEGLTAFNPLPPRRFHLVHAFNRIPLGATPFVIGFESDLPRAYGLEESRYYAWLIRMLESPRCRGIFPISRHAQAIFEHALADRPERGALLAKTRLRYPNLPLDLPADSPPPGSAPIRVTFVGAHFARKGGCVGVRLAEIARQRGAPICVDIVSSLQMGRGIWTDPTRDHYFDRYRALLDAPNVTRHGPLDNHEVLSLLDRSHFSLLTTFGDTFGYSALESMARGVPVIATAQGALPEFIEDGVNGVLLPLPTNALGDWRYAAAPDRDTAAFEARFTAEVERLAAECYDRLIELVDDPRRYAAMREAAAARIQTQFNADDASVFWDSVYETTA